MYDFVILYRAKSIVRKRTVFASLKSSPQTSLRGRYQKGRGKAEEIRGFLPLRLPFFALAMNATPNPTTCVQILVVA